MKVKSESEVPQSCPTLSDSMDCSPPGSSVHGIFQARVLEWRVLKGIILRSRKWRLEKSSFSVRDWGGNLGKRCWENSSTTPTHEAMERDNMSWSWDQVASCSNQEKSLDYQESLEAVWRKSWLQGSHFISKTWGQSLLSGPLSFPEHLLIRRSFDEQEKTFTLLLL